MNSASADCPSPELWERVLLCSPRAGDIALIAPALEKARFAIQVCTSLDHLTVAMQAGAGVVVMAVETLSLPGGEPLMQALALQAPESALPAVILLPPGGAAAGRWHPVLDKLPNGAFLERPVSLMTLTSTVRVALAARRYQHETRRLQEALRSSLQERGDWFVRLSDELRDPLAAISNSVALLRDVQCSRPPLQILRDILERQTARMSRLLDELLDVSWITNGTLDARPAAAGLEAAGERSPSQEPRDVLVVGGDREAARNLTLLLESLRHRVHTVSADGGALDAARFRRPDLIVVDLGTPAGDGGQFAQQLRKDPAFDPVLLIALTPSGSAHGLEPARVSGFDGYLLKPIELEALRALLAKLPAAPTRPKAKN